jgi:aconitate hydratase
VVIAQSYERIHRSNLLGMGILPLEFKDGQNADSLELNGHEQFSFDFHGEHVGVGQDVTVVTSTGKTFVTKCRLDTDPEVAYFENGGILRYVMRKLL